MKTEIFTADYHCSIASPGTAKEAFDNICNVPAWWTTDFEGSAKETGDIFTVRFGDTFVTFRITDVVAGETITWYVTDCHIPWLNDKKEWKDTKIVWEVSSKNNSTQIDMTHVGMVPTVECYASCEQGWNHFIKESLFKLLAEGKGLPKEAK